MANPQLVPIRFHVVKYFPAKRRGAFSYVERLKFRGFGLIKRPGMTPVTAMQAAGFRMIHLKCQASGPRVPAKSILNTAEIIRGVEVYIVVNRDDNFTPGVANAIIACHRTDILRKLNQANPGIIVLDF